LGDGAFAWHERLEGQNFRICKGNDGDGYFMRGFLTFLWHSRFGFRWLGAG